MASKTVLMSALFDQFTSFLSELSDMYPADSDFSLFSTSIRLLRATNPSMLAKYIYENTNHYEEKIMSRDEKFFLDTDFSEYSDYIEDMNIFGKLKQYVASMSDSSKESVWKYCQNIIRLAKACYSP
jgi:hypothetical protein